VLNKERLDATPWEILRQLPGVAWYLKEGVTVQSLEQQARIQSNMAAAEKMQAAKEALFRSFHRKRTA
jgi:hypothetical protein